MRPLRARSNSAELAVPRDRGDFLDRPAARLIAGLVIILCVALLAYIHRDDWRASDTSIDVGGAEAPPDDPAKPCIQQRFAEIDAMIDDGVVDDGQAALFRERAEAMCRATMGDGEQIPPLPVD